MLRTPALSLLALMIFLASPGLLAGQAADNHVAVVNDGVEEAYAKAIETLVETAWRGYVKELGLPLPELITVNLRLNPGEEVRLFTDGKGEVFLNLASMDQLLPSPQSGVLNIYGFCHELGHIAMYHRMKKVAGINSGVAEGWAHFCGSIVCDHVYAKHGRKLWPKPFDYRKLEGTQRLRRLLKKIPRDPGEAEDFDLAVRGFWKLYLLVKKEKFFRAVDACLKTAPSGDEFLPRFLDEIRAVSGKKRLPDYFPERLMKKQFQWSPGPPDLASQTTFRDLEVTREKSGGSLLHYNHEAPDPEVCRSIAGTGYLQLFRLPEKGNGRLTRVEIFGCRYGSRRDDDADVVVWIADAEMKVLKTHRFKYRELNSGDRAWFRIPGLKPVEVPRHFFVGVFFDAHATKGYFMGYQKKIHGHSYTGTPTTGLTLLRGQDWMMRVSVKTGKAGP